MLSELDALAILTGVRHLGSIRIRLLIQRFGSPQAALDAPVAEITALPDFGLKIVEQWGYWHRDASWKLNFELAEKLGVELIPYSSPRYPKRLLDVPDYPIMLYVKGQITATDQQGIAVVGTRQASIYGLEMAEQISQGLAAAGFSVVSGLARGIDTAAHRGALRRGRTLAVIGSGLADIYPQENRELAHTLAEGGALISEFPMATPPDRQNFPQRNRIVAGITLGTLLVEAPLKSGAMLTIERALSYQRKVFALPGRADNEDFRGNHQLIKRGQAQLVESAEDVIAHFDNLFARGYVAYPSVVTRVALSDEEEKLLKILPKHELSIDEIVHLTKLPVMRINILLMSLLLKKAIREFPGKLYKKLV